MAGTEKSAAVIPATLVTGFLGSGKTTLLNGLLAQPELGDTAVIVNEFGAIGLDHLLIETSFEDAVLLKSGCICCTVRGDLVDTMLSLAQRRRDGAIPPFARVAIETTGLADPVPILHLLMGEPALTALYRLARVVTTVDAVNGESQLAEHAEPARQAAVADRLVLTKTDLAAPEAASRLEARLRALNPDAPIIPVVQGRIAAAALFGDAAVAPTRRLDRARGLGDAHAGHDHGVGEVAAAHSHGIHSFCLTHQAPIAWPALQAWLTALASLRGPELLRMKGIVDIAGRDGPVAIDGVQHVFHPPRQLRRWPDADRRTRIVFITRHLSESAIRASFDAVVVRERNHR